jgi:esterase
MAAKLVWLNMMLEMTRYDGPATQVPCLIAHGLYGSARNWNVIAKRLSAERAVITVDMRNHGQSFHASSHNYEDMANDLAQIVEHIGAPVHVLGHSMGGKAAMALALMRADLVAKLIVGDIAPVAYTHTQLPYIHAMRQVDFTQVTRRSDAQAQLEALGIEPPLQAFFTQSLDLKNKRWLYNLDTLEANMPDIMGFPEVGGVFSGQTLFLSGGESDYVLPRHRPKIKSLFPSAKFAKLPGAGHWLHAQKPKAFCETVAMFLRS